VTGIPGEDLQGLFAAQRAAFDAERVVSARARIDRIDRALALLLSHQRRLCEAVEADFGQRPHALTRFMDIFPAVHALKFARRNLRRWMRPQRSRVGLPLGVPGTRAEIRHQPLGVIGLISPWNFPITLSFGPLAGILAAGNRCLIKPSELTPATGALLRELSAAAFDPTELDIVCGGPEVAQAFSRLPFDHLLFTGSGAVGRRVMAAAAEHLVPVTLELGGKCPVVVGRSASVARAVDRILIGKLANAGQICLAPDYVYVPRRALDAFVREARRWTHRTYPGLPANPDYTSLVSAAHAERARQLLADAEQKGAQVIDLTDQAPGSDAASRLIPPALILGASDAMRIMREEIFAPLLPVCPYDSLEEVIAAINARERPLALYYFGHDAGEEAELLARTTSGGVTVNDVLAHVLAEELPFGGVGASGMGAYHGEHGFRRFSHARTVFRQTRLDVAGLIGLRPPYGERLRRSLQLLLRR